MIFEGKTVEEATANALSELKVSEKDITVTVVEEPAKGLFGKSKGVFKIDVTVKENGEKQAVEFIQGIIDILDITAKAKLDEEAENTKIEIIAEKSSEIIGYRGEVLDALQTLATAIVNSKSEEYKKVVVDCENYRGKREDTLIELAHKLENKANDMKREVLLEPMNPYERRIIHTALAESSLVTTKSEGKEPNRYVIIVPFNKEEYSTPYNAGRNNDRNKDKKHGGKFEKKGKTFNDKNRKKPNGFSDVQRKKPSGFGTFLGNSLKDTK